MINGSIQMFRNLLKQGKVSPFWIIVILIRIIYDDFILFEHLQFNNNIFIVMNDTDNGAILIFYFDNGNCNTD